MIKPLKIICAGVVGWDTIGQTELHIVAGKDLPGKIETNVGGVAANIAIALANQINPNQKIEITLLSSVGNDQKSDLLLSILSKHHKINCNYVIKEEGTSDGYVCIECNGELFGAISSSAQLEKSCIKIFERFVKQQQVQDTFPFTGYFIIDSNLTAKAIEYLTFDPFFNKTNFIIACASPHKASKVRSLMKKRKCSIYTNLDEAASILGYNPSNSSEAANKLFKLGAKEATVTNGKKQASSRSASGLVSVTPEITPSLNTTGAGDAFLAAHFLSLILSKELSKSEHLEKAELAARKEISSLPER